MMTRILLLAVLGLLALTPLRLQAQSNPEDSLLQFQGCHFFNKKMPVYGKLGPMTFDCGSNARSDSIDVLNYDVTLDLTDFSQEKIKAACGITFTALQDGIDVLPLDLLNLTVDSVVQQNGAPLGFSYDGLLLEVDLAAPLYLGDTLLLTVYYRGKPTADPSGFGGLVFENNIAYNLGIGLSSNPYNFGRSWHPCFDNFVERATYDFQLITNGGRSGYAIGEFLGQADLGGDTIARHYRMNQPLPTYLVGVAASTYAAVEQTHEGIYGEYPLLLVGKPGDTTAMKSAFSYLGDAVDALESWFGPYIWGQVGYVMTTAGAMEHSTLIAYPDFIIDDGPSFSMNRLMAHELGHHWWGNITTLSCPSDMWIKEGNAEYSAHLFTEHTFGREAFVKQVKDNHYSIVLRQAHIEDEGYWPLSGIPYEHTYGTHTYNKGASIMHNLRGYLGDSLFHLGMQSMLEAYQYQAVDASLFRDHLSQATGVDMSSFFNDWIFSPGFALYELDSVSLSPGEMPGDWEAVVHVQQKLRAAPHFHTDVPLEITFFDENRNAHTVPFMVSGEFSTVQMTLPFRPVWQVLNDNNRLNLGRMQHRALLTQSGMQSLPYCDVVNFEAKEVPDTALISFVHYWAAPDPIEPNPGGTLLSGTHYWRFGGILPEGFKAKVFFPYKAANPNEFDYELLSQGDDDQLILAWRPDAAAPWLKYPYYKRTALGSTGGLMRVDTLLPGDYTFAMGDLPLATAADERRGQAAALEIFPNPGTAVFNLRAMLPVSGPVQVSLYDAMGCLVRQEMATAGGEIFTHQLEAEGLPSGFYFARVSTQEGLPLAAGRVLVKR
jgi:aminopeptidase N